MEQMVTGVREWTVLAELKKRQEAPAGGSKDSNVQLLLWSDQDGYDEKWVHRQHPPDPARCSGDEAKRVWTLLKDGQWRFLQKEARSRIDGVEV